MLSIGSVTAPRTIPEVQEILAFIGLPTLNPTALMTISQCDGENFKAALVETANQEPGWERHKQYIGSMITASVPETRAVIDKLGLEQPSPSALLEVCKQEGRAFTQAIKCLRKGGEGPDIDAMRHYLRTTLGSVGSAPEPDQKSAPQRQAPSLSVVPPPASPPMAQERTPPNQQPSSERDMGYHAQPSSIRGSFDARREQWSNEPGNQERRFQSHHVYGGTAALCFSLDTTRKIEKPTVRIEGAPALQARTYDWSKKVAIQLTVSELPLVFGVLYGFIQKVELTGHGHENEKSFTIEDQGDKFFLSMRIRSGGAFAVPVPPKDTYPLMTMLLMQLIQNSPGLPPQQILMLAKRICDKHPAPTPRSAAKG